MSHLKERKDKNCLNCNAVVQGRYCHICGQENIEPKESVLHLVNHFFQDITHFDGKFFSSLKLLITRPGYLPRAYMLGRRSSYLNPIRMYVFTSAFFFLIFFSFFKVDKKTLLSNSNINGKTLAQVMAMDSVRFDAFTKNINEGDDKGKVPMTRSEFKHYFDSVITEAPRKFTVHFTNADYKTKAAYDSALQSGVKKHSWWQRQLIYKEIEINEKYRNNPEGSSNVFVETLLHSLPQMFFISLPFFALLLKMLYARRKQYYYVSHGVFSIHFFVFIFIAMLVLFGLGKLNMGHDWAWIAIIEAIIVLGIFFYLYKAMRNFYLQRRAKTITKFLLLCFSFLIFLSLLFTIFVFFSLFKL